MKAEDFQDAVVTVMGLGRFLQGSGVGATKWLMRHGAQCVITDLKSEEELRDSIDEVMKWFKKYKAEIKTREIYHPVFVMGEHHEEDFINASFVVQNPDVPRESEFLALAKENKVQIISDVAIFYELNPHPFVAVTGAKGKSTTVSMIGAIMAEIDDRSVVAGNIKVSPLEYLDEIMEEREPRPVTLELSSWLLETLDTIDRGPEVAVLTNLYEEHLNRYDSMDHYVEAKGIIFKNQTADQACVLNFDQDRTRELEPKVPSRLFWFSKTELPEGKFGAFARGDELVWRNEDGEEVVMQKSELAQPGNHNLENALAAIAVARLRDVESETIREALSTFEGVADRQELIDEIGGVKYINDTTATAPAAAIAALQRFGQKGNVVLLAGGADKGLGFDELGNVIRATCKHVVLFEGTATDKLAAAIGKDVSTMRVDSMPKAVEAAREIATEGDVVLLSPGCASFGIFKNEFDRGDQFKEEVGKIS